MTRRPPYVSTVLATALVLSLVGIYGLTLLQGRELLRELREATTVVIELRPGSDAAGREQLADYLEAQAFVKPGSVTYVSKEDGAQRLQDEFGEGFMEFDLENPLFDLYTFNVAERYVEPGAIARFRSEIDQQSAVLATYVQEDMVNTLTQRVGALAWVGLGLGVVLLAGVMFLIVNTTRLALLAKATLIKNMELVGASWGFISRPFLQQSAWLGMGSGLLAVSTTVGFGAFAKTYLPMAWQTVPVWQYAVLAAVLFALGLLLNVCATWMVVRRTLRLRDDDLAFVGA